MQLQIFDIKNILLTVGIFQSFHSDALRTVRSNFVSGVTSSSFPYSMVAQTNIYCKYRDQDRILTRVHRSKLYFNQRNYMYASPIRLNYKKLNNVRRKMTKNKKR